VLDSTINCKAANAKFNDACKDIPGFFEGDSWKVVTIQEFPNGVEVFLDENKRTWRDGAAFDAENQPEKSLRGEGDREKNIERSARRAKTQVRRRAKMIGANTLLTLTYRENMVDEVRAQADFKAFRARLHSLGEFPYVATLEKQQRGAIHIHIACQRFPAYLKNQHGVRVKSYNVIRSMWRRVVGSDNGNVDISPSRGRNSAHRIAAYIAKYAMKNITDSTFNKKCYWSSRHIPRPKVIKLWFDPDTTNWELVSMLAQEFELRGFSDIAQYSDRFNQFHWFAASKP
jgi:hypothetical protein